MRMRVPQEPGRSGRLPEGHTGKGDPVYSSPRARGRCAPRPPGAKEERCRGTAVRRKRSAAGQAFRSRSRP
jgi:hypothetical protein